jgi:hypothetical protein
MEFVLLLSIFLSSSGWLLSTLSAPKPPAAMAPAPAAAVEAASAPGAVDPTILVAQPSHK